jgi:hypothetical protein
MGAPSGLQRLIQSHSNDYESIGIEDKGYKQCLIYDKSDSEAHWKIKNLSFFERIYYKYLSSNIVISGRKVINLAADELHIDSVGINKPKDIFAKILVNQVQADPLNDTSNFDSLRSSQASSSSSNRRAEPDNRNQEPDYSQEFKLAVSEHKGEHYSNAKDALKPSWEFINHIYDQIHHREEIFENEKCKDPDRLLSEICDDFFSEDKKFPLGYGFLESAVEFYQHRKNELSQTLPANYRLLTNFEDKIIREQIRSFLAQLPNQHQESFSKFASKTFDGATYPSAFSVFEDLKKKEGIPSEIAEKVEKIEDLSRLLDDYLKVMDNYEVCLSETKSNYYDDYMIGLYPLIEGKMFHELNSLLQALKDQKIQ